MKIHLRILFAFFLLSFITNLEAQSLDKSREIERVYVSTDRDTYIAGETVWVSAYCFDFSEGSLVYSDLSKVLYIELHNIENMVATCKIYIVNGRGGGSFELPTNIPTGNYKLVAYTKYMLNETSPTLFQRDIPVVSPLSGAKIKENVKIVETLSESTTDQVDDVSRGLDSNLSVKIDKEVVEKNSVLKLLLNNSGIDPLSLSVSVYRNDKIFSDFVKTGIDIIDDSYKTKAEVSFENNNIPEIEGEIVKGKIFADNEKIDNKTMISMSAIGKDINLYLSEISNTGDVTFFTNNFTGKSEIVIESYNSKDIGNYRVEFEEPFINYRPEFFNTLFLAKNSADVIEKRLFEMQISRRFGVYKSVEEIFKVQNPLMDAKIVTYKLDDYKRFLTLHETIIEYVSELQFRKIFDQYGIRSYLETVYTNPDSYDEAGVTKVLLLFDGVPIYDHSILADYDAYKIESIRIIPRRLYINKRYYEGVVMINSFSGKLDGVQMNENAVIMDYNAPQLASKFTFASSVGSDRLPDVRSLLYWDPVLNIGAGEQYETSVYTSTLPGEYCIEIEGLSTSGEAVYIRKYFTVSD